MRLASIKTRILGGFAALILLQAAVAAAVWRAEDRVDAATAADSAAASSIARVVAARDALSAVQLRLANFARTGTAADRAEADGALHALHEQVARLGDLGERSAALAGDLTDVDRALDQVFKATTGQRDEVANLAQAGSEQENALLALPQAMTKAPDRAAVESAARLLASSVHLMVYAQRFGFTGDPTDAQTIQETAAKVREGLKSLASDNGELPPRIIRVIKTIDTGVAGLPSMIEKVAGAMQARQASLRNLDDLAVRARAVIVNVLGDLAAERTKRQAETMEARAAVRATVIGAAAAACLFGVGLALLVGLSITRPIGRLAAAMRRLADGATDQEVPDRSRRDEIGGMAGAVQVFKDNMVRAERLTVEQAALKAEAGAAQKAAMDKTADDFEVKIGGLVGILSSAATELEATAQGMSQTALDATGRASAVASAADEATKGVQTVAAAAEELTASIEEISRQVAHSSAITDQAVSDARRTDAIVRKLALGADKIGHVLELITTIAGQTNLLALNATIEAARAGDAGKGFAVVASEVKTLANQTAKAAESISAQIADIQLATKEAVGAIRDIAETIAEVSTIATSIAGAVEQQGAATAEIARNVQQTARSADEVSVNIAAVTRASTETGASADEVLTAASGLSRQAAQLTLEVSSFVAEVRAA